MPGESDGGAGSNGSGRGGQAGDRGTGARGDVGAGVERGDLEDIEIGGGDGAKIVKVRIVPARVRGAGDVHGRTVVGKDEAVFFHGLENDLIGGGEGRDIEAGLETETRAHGRSGGVGGGGGSPVGGGRSESSTGILQCETDRVIDGACGDFIVANESREDGETGGVGAGPGVGALLVGEKIPDSAGTGVPGSGLGVGTVELVEEAVGVIENEDVAIAVAGVGVAFDIRGERDGHGAGIGLGGVGGVVDGDERLSGIDNGVGNADIGAVVEARTEVGMDAGGGADVRDDGGGVGVDGRGGNVFVPEIV